MVSYLKLIHNGVLKTVALYDGIDPDELSALLSTVFSINNKIVGIMGEKGLVVPLSLICKSPEVAPNSVCKLLTVVQPKSLSSSLAPQSETVANDNSSQQIGNSVTSDAAIAAEEYSQMVSDDDSVEFVTQEIRRFLGSLKLQRVLLPSQHRLLSQLLNENSNLLFAAYSVAISANDSEYFAEICKDLASSLETEQGRVACEAQDEVLQICDQLYINDKITENQLLYLRHLVLIREEAVATLYDEFQEHQSVPLLAKSLFELANTHPFQTASTASNEDDAEGKGISFDTEDVPSSSDDENEEEEEVREGNSKGNAIRESNVEDEILKSPVVPRRKSSALIAKGLTGVISLMGRASLISKTELSVLYELVEQENEYVFAAYELYEKNKNLEDLQDTLVRCVRLEIRKRVTDIQEKELAAMQEERKSERNTDDENAVEAEEGNSDGNDQRESSDEEEPATSESHDEISLDDISLSTILQSLNVTNVWDKVVPELFLKTVFISVIRNQLTAEQAQAVCDLFQARYDLVHAAWEVYTVQRDATDFIDTMRRIIRDVRGDETREEEPDESPEARDSSSEKGGEGTNPTESAEESDKADVEQSLQDRKAEALLAVSAAKRELLKHSLEMMVKQKMTSAEKAQDLYARYLAGDVLTDAAIEAYASDRDVGEFLDTLQVLANNSKEDLDILMRAVAGETDEESGSKKAEEDIALSQIEEIVTEMLKSDMIGPGIAEEFRKLIRNRDSRLIEAYNVYQSNKSGAELVNSLLKIVIAAVEEIPKAADQNKQETKSSQSPAKSTSDSPAQKKIDEERSDSGNSVALDPEDQKTVVEILMRAKAIDSAQYEGLSKLIEQGNKEVAGIFGRYEENKDVYALIDALKSINIGANKAQPSTLPGQKSESLDRSDRDGEEEDDDESYEEDFDDDNGIVVEEKFMQIIQNMRLSDLETAALRLAIAENDPSIRSAIDRFRTDLDELNLMNAMKDAARGVIQRTLTSRMGLAFAQGSSSNQERNENGDTDEAKNSPSQIKQQQTATKALLSPAKATGGSNYEEEFDEIEDLEEEDDDEEEEEEDDDVENEGSGVLLSQTARDHIFPILVQELIKENIISKPDGRLILQEFAAGNPVIASALDAYDEDNDMGSLVEALQQMVENIRKA